MTPLAKISIGVATSEAFILVCFYGHPKGDWQIILKKWEKWAMFTKYLLPNWQMK
jgi:hypothetical protein